MLLDTMQEINITHNYKGEPHKIKLTWQIFGRELNTAPLVVVNHALTGDSTVTGPGGWWYMLVGHGMTIDLDRFTVLAFDIPGNGYNENAEYPLPDYKDMTTRDVARIFWKGLDYLGQEHIYALIGGSLGGGIAWEMALQQAHRIEHLIPIACSIKASDWLIGNVLVQDQILHNSSNPIIDARMHAMHLYRTPASFAEKFQGRVDGGKYEVENWLHFHGRTLQNRFYLSSYKLMNHLLGTIGKDLTEEDIIEFAQAETLNIHCIAIDSDYLFPREEQWRTYNLIHKHKQNIYFSEIQSIHGHDAFLIEDKQLHNLLKHIF